MKGALLAETDILPDVDENLFLNTSDQHEWNHLEPPFSEEDYMFSLQQNEGITDLFDIDAFDPGL